MVPALKGKKIGAARLDRILILPIYRAVQRIRGQRTTETDPVVLAITQE